MTKKEYQKRAETEHALSILFYKLGRAPTIQELKKELKDATQQNGKKKI